ncbi:MAG: AAA family ATPase [Anaerolineaceae bacterium]|nr:AAA family ATPase [Anaerolineaceae bacterium]
MFVFEFISRKSCRWSFYTLRGVGKTSTSVNLAHGLTLRNKKVLTIDLDPQGQCATKLGLENQMGAYYFLTTQPPSINEINFVK